MHQRRHGVGQQPIEELAVLRAEVAQQMIIDSHTATNPQISQIALTQSVDLTGTADRFDGREQPECHADLRIDRIASGPTFNGLDFRVQRTQVERVDIDPDDSGSMIGRQQLVECHRSPFYLIALGSFDPRPTRRTGCDFAHTQVLAPGS